MTAKIGIICGLASEEKIARRAGTSGEGITIRVSGASADRAYAAACELAASGIDILVSFGVAGGLARQLEPGTIIIGDFVQSSDGTLLRASQTLVERLSHAAQSSELETKLGNIAGVDKIVDTPAKKRLLAERSGALAIDMESHAVAKAATGRGVAFAVIRSIADPADRAIPAAALSVIGPTGRVRPLHAAKAILGRPQDILQLIRLGRDNTAALKSLSRAAEVFFPVLG